jgi:hypothetical protein
MEVFKKESSPEVPKETEVVNKWKKEELQ